MHDEPANASMLQLQCSEPEWRSVEIPVPKPADADTSLKADDLDTYEVYKQLKRSFRDGDMEVEPVGYNRSVLLEEGVLEVPFLMRKGNLGVAVYVYPQSDTINGAHFAGVQDALQRLDYAPPVYYAPKPLPAARPVDVLRSFSFDLFRELENGTAPNGTYAMWWPTDDESLFCNSKTHRFLGQLYETMNGIESYLLANVLRAFDVLPPDNADAQQVPLTEQPWILPLLGPELAPVYMVADEQRGVQFYLHAQSATRVYRERFYKHLLGYVRRERERIMEAGLPLDTYESAEESPLGYWLLAERTVQMREGQGAQMEYFGGLEALLEDDTPLEAAPAEAIPTGEDEESDELAAPAPAPAPKSSDRVTQVLYAIITLLFIVWTVLAGVRLFNNEEAEETAVIPIGEVPIADEVDDDADSPLSEGSATALAIPPPEAATATTVIANEATEAPEATDVVLPEAPDTAEAEVPDDATPAFDSTMAEAPEVAEEGPEVPEETVAPTAPEVAEVPEAPEAPEVPEVTEVVDVPVEPAEPVGPGGVQMKDLRFLPLTFKRPVSRIAFASRTPQLLVIEGDLARVFSLRQRGTPIRSLPATSAALSPNGATLATHINDINNLVITNMTTGQKVHTLQTDEGVDALHFSTDGAWLLSRGADLRIYDTKQGSQRLVIAPEQPVLDAAFGANAEYLYTLEAAALVSYSIETGEEARRLPLEPASPHRRLAISPAANEIIISEKDQLVVVDLESFEQSQTLAIGDGSVRAFAVAPGSRLTGVLAGDQRLWLWPGGDKALVPCLTPTTMEDIAFTADGRLIALRDRQRIFVWETEALLEAHQP